MYDFPYCRARYCFSGSVVPRNHVATQLLALKPQQGIASNCLLVLCTIIRRIGINGTNSNRRQYKGDDDGSAVSPQASFFFSSVLVNSSKVHLQHFVRYSLTEPVMLSD